MSWPTATVSRSTSDVSRLLEANQAGRARHPAEVDAHSPVLIVVDETGHISLYWLAIQSVPVSLFNEDSTRAASIEAQLKEQIWERMRQRLGDEYLAEHADFLGAQLEWAKEQGMIDEEVDLIAEG